MASSSADAASADDALVRDVEEKLRRLNARLPDLDGKVNKKERSAVNKEIYALQNDGKYVAAKKEQLSGARAAAAEADDAAHAAKIAAEAAETAAREERTRLDRRWQDASERELWYEGGSKYWEQQTVGDNNGVLGGFADVHVQDTRDSLKFARKLPLRPGEVKPVDEDPPFPILPCPPLISLPSYPPLQVKPIDGRGGA